MNAHLLAGIGALSIVVVLILLSSLGPAFVVNVETVESVSANQLFRNEEAPLTSVHVQTWSVENNFFMPRKYELPNLMACLSAQGELAQEPIYLTTTPLVSALNLNPYEHDTMKVYLQPRYLYKEQPVANYTEIIIVESDDMYYRPCLDIEQEDILATIPISS